MKRLIIVRHAKSVHYGYDDDFNRDLSERGEKDATKIGKRLFSMNIQPDIMVSSPATRALKTARIFARALGYPSGQIEENPDLYDGITSHEFIGLIQSLPDEIGVAFYFGHNPAFYYFVNSLLKHFDGEMPTCSTVAIDFDTDSWVNASAQNGIKAFQLVPKMFK